MNKERITSQEWEDKNVQSHPEIGVTDGAKQMPTERTWQDMWPKNDKHQQQQDDDENAYVAICKIDTGKKSIEQMNDDEKERTWNDMWP